MHGPGQAGAIGAGIHAGLFGHDHAPGAGGQDPQHLLVDLGTDSKGDDRRRAGQRDR